MKKIINITHTDLDGIGCPIVLQSLFPQYEVVPIYSGYHDVEKNIQKVLDDLTGEVFAVYITDISFREESGLARRIESLNYAMGYNFIQVIDHHATSGYLNQYDWAWSHESDSNGELKCGTQWTYEIVSKSIDQSELKFLKIQKSLEEFVRLVNLWDTWRWVTDYPANSPCEEASQLNMVFSVKGKKKFFEDYIRKIADCSEMFGLAERELIECKLYEIESDFKKKESEMIVTELTYTTSKKNLDFIKNYLDANHITDKKFLLNPRFKMTYKVGIVFLSNNISDVCNKLAKEHPELDFVMSINLPTTISLRSAKDLEVPLGIIANAITGKGGGHPKSAGGVLSSRLSKWVASKVIGS